MVKVLLTAFEPFGKDVENAAAIVCEQIPACGDHYQAEKRILPTEFQAGAETLMQAIDQVQPELVICLGQAGGRANVTPERLAINLMDAVIPDNCGFQPDDESVIPGGPEAYFTNIPVKAVVQQARESGYPVQLSYSAGAYVCNCVFYHLMNRIAYTPANEATPALWGEFIHIPYVQEQQGLPEGAIALPVSQVRETVAYLIEMMAERKEKQDEGFGL